MKQITNFNNHHFNDETETHKYIKPKDLNDGTFYTVTGMYYIKNCKYPHYNIKCIDTDNTRFFVSVPKSLDDTIREILTDPTIYDDINCGNILLQKVNYVSKKYGENSTVAIYCKE